MTRRRAFWPGQSGQSVPPGFLGDADGERRQPAVRWRTVDHPLYVDDVEHGPDPDAAFEPPAPVEQGPDAFAPYDRYGRFDDAYRFDDLGGYDDGDAYDDGLDHYELAHTEGGVAGAAGSTPEPDALDPLDPTGGGLRPLDDMGVADDRRREAGHEHGEGPSGRSGVPYHFDDLADHDGRDPTEPLAGGDGAAQRSRWARKDAGTVLRDMLVDRDDYRVEPRPRRNGRGRRLRLALAERLVAAWPGQSEEGAPPGFPASGELVLYPPPEPRPSSGGTVVRMPVRGQPHEPLDREFDEFGAEVDDEFEVDSDDEVGELGESRESDDVARRVGRFGGRRTRDERAAADREARRAPAAAAVASPRSLQKIAMAVYAALADPIANADPETRERRTLQVRRFGVLAGSAALAVVLIYAIFPVRTYLEQRAAAQRTSERHEKLREANAELEEREDQLQDPETIIEIARRDYQLVFPGEESYGLLPPPVPPTTTTTSPDG